MSNLCISLFGRFHIEYRGKPLTSGFDSTKVQELLSYLLIYRERPHPREALAELLWGDAPGVQAKKYLRQALWQLQAALKSEGQAEHERLLLADSDWVAVNTSADFWLDVAAFESAFARVQGRQGHELDAESVRALVNAVDYHRGGLLEGWYHDWCLFERERLQNMYLAMLHKLMVYFEAHQQYELALSYGTRILQCDRAHERTHWRMMRLYYLAGDRTAALRQYERCVAALQEELGVGPARWTVELYEQVRADRLQDSLLAPVPAAAAVSVVSSEYIAQLGKLQALLEELQQEMQQHLQVAGMVKGSPG